VPQWLEAVIGWLAISAQNIQITKGKYTQFAGNLTMSPVRVPIVVFVYVFEILGSV
jgi:hypothetical protein